MTLARMGVRKMPGIRSTIRLSHNPGNGPPSGVEGVDELTADLLD